MNRKSFIIRSLGVAIAVAAVTLCSFNARAEIVFGNLPAMEMAAWSDTSTDFGPTSYPNPSLVHGFTIGILSLTVDSVILGPVDASAANTVSLHANASNAPQEPLLMSNAAHCGEQNKSLCDFAAVFLAPNAGSWIAPQQVSNWYLSLDEPQPTGLIGADYASPEMDRQGNSNPGTQVIASQPSRHSVEAIPQRSSPVIAGLGVGGIAMLARRRRRRTPA